MLKYRKIILKEDFDGKKTLIYNGKKYNEITQQDFNNILEKINFGNSFALPDKMVQDFVYDGSINPTFKNVKTFTNSDLEAIIKPFKKKVNKRKYKKTIKRKNKRKPKKKTKQTKNRKRK